MEIPHKLNAALDSLYDIDIKQLKQAAENISRRYRNESNKTVLTKEEALAYAYTRMPATYAAVYSALENIEGNISTLLDAGAGTGSASWAALELFDLEHITCVESERVMTDIGKNLMNVQGIKADWVIGDISNINTEKADLVIASYMLNELEETKQFQIIEKLWSKALKHLLIVEPGTPKNYIQMMKLRDHMISKGAWLNAPCPHNDRCRLSKNDWCHFIKRVARSKTHKLLKSGDAPYEDEKFTYLLFSKEKTDGDYCRVIRRPKIEKGYINLNLCTKNGIVEETITKSNGLYKQAKKAKCNDKFYFNK